MSPCLRGEKFIGGAYAYIPVLRLQAYSPVQGRDAGAVERLALADEQQHQGRRDPCQGRPADREGQGRHNRGPEDIPHGDNAVLRVAHRPGESDLPRAAPGNPAPPGDAHRRERPGRSAARGFRQPRPRTDAPLSRPRAPPRHAHLLDELPPLHSQAHSRRGRREHERRVYRRGHRVHPEDDDHPRRADLRRRSTYPVRREARRHHQEDTRHRTRRDNPNRDAYACRHASAHHRQARVHAKAVPPAVYQHAF